MIPKGDACNDLLMQVRYCSAQIFPLFYCSCTVTSNKPLSVPKGVLLCHIILFRVDLFHCPCFIFPFLGFVDKLVNF